MIKNTQLRYSNFATFAGDRLIVAVLAEIAQVDDIQALASQQFKAKSKELAGLSAQ
jgi:hypothetical protein